MVINHIGLMIVAYEPQYSLFLAFRNVHLGCLVRIDSSKTTISPARYA